MGQFEQFLENPGSGGTVGLWCKDQRLEVMHTLEDASSEHCILYTEQGPLSSVQCAVCTVQYLVSHTLFQGS